MRWGFRRPEPTEAERSLTSLREQPPVPDQPGSPLDPTDPMAGFRVIPGLEHLATATDMSFGLKVCSATTDAAGHTVLTAPRAEGTVAAGDLVGLLLIAAPDNAPGVLDGDPERARAVAAEIRAALGTAWTASATVVSFAPAGPASPAVLVVHGIPADAVPAGTLVMR